MPQARRITPAILFSRDLACDIAGVTPAEVERWEQAFGLQFGAQRDGSLSLRDVLGLCVLRELASRLGARLWAFGPGFAQLLNALAQADEPDRLDDHVAIVGPDYARLCQARADHLRCAGDGFLTVSLGPLLADLRDQVFS
jgi:hypothetical protein